jgi:hexosaminidase
LWSDTLTNFRQAELLILPRLPGYAELGWSQPAGLSWSGYRVRLASQAPRWTARGLDYYRDPVVPWTR